ncbi:SagB/ThcOx family dehydrogenase [Thiorhodococcus minor]|uniref:SagB/ThcOx family dehydrogenase n=1 Tax=Thiorhodococcus minor TaxID=57489 RepID=A0A6M0JYC0_9GAMM|nr:SagB/ThcOx family dehydrogenase [Thiorhodococcus minor]NEV61643.1 SagB/ThcOx family dehydrogenase [Thiorhodococcus minor]
MSEQRLRQVYAYHFDSKHRPERYAPGPGGLDWATQPDPFRTFEDVPRIRLPLPTQAGPAFADVRAGRRPEAARVDLGHLAALLRLSMGLSAWKAYGDARWALRCNPSSGNLHPTECYLVTGGCLGVPGGVYHYHSHDHCLEERASELTEPAAAAEPAGLVIALTSVHWREAWKYGLRAYRYCQHDVGHALAAIGYAAATLGWSVEPLDWPDAALAARLGIDRAADFDPQELEAPDLAVWIGKGPPRHAEIEALLNRPRSYAGRARPLSPDHVDWPGIHLVHQACERDSPRPVELAEAAPLPPLVDREGGQGAAALIRQRRSAVAFDGRSAMTRDAWLSILDALLPRAGVPPFDAWPRAPRVSLILFVHRVSGVTPGLYALVRSPEHLDRLRKSLRPDWLWSVPDEVPAHLGLYRLVDGDACDAARALSCHQAIAGDSCFAVAMLADFDVALADGAWRYRELFWECGSIGQALYLEAEAAGLRGTGIGCFFDDAVHALLGIQDTRWQSLYHFTVGAPVEDVRLRTEPPYAHLGN